MEEPLIYKIKDVEFKVTGFTQKVQEQFAKFMQWSFLNLIKANRDNLGDDYLSLIQKHILDIKLGYMDFGSDLYYEFIKHNDHFGHLMQLCLSNEHQKITVKEVIEWVKNNEEDSVELYNMLMESKKN